MLQPHEDISIFFGLDLEYFIILESNSFNIRLKGKEVKEKGEEGERGGKRPKTMSPHRHNAVKPATGQAKVHTNNLNLRRDCMVTGANYF